MKADRARPSPPGPPPSLAYLAEQAVGIDAECRDCRHRVVLGFEKFLARYGDMPFPDFTRLMKCSACGSRHVDVRPAWPSCNIEKPRPVRAGA
jgi:DNA-directed RNA polymerase subunit RPC12/RpoP